MRILLININFLFGLQNATFRRFPLVSLLVILKRSQPERDRKTSSSNTTETQEEEADGDTNNHKFQCPKEGYTRGFQRYSSLEKHIAFGKCTNVVEREILLDRAKLKYAVILQGG